MAPLSPTGQPSPDGLTPGSVRELASGVDALYLSAEAELPEQLMRRLDLRRAVAQAGQTDVPFSFGGVEFGLAPYAWGKYRYRLAHEFCLVGITTSKSLPSVRIQPRAEFLHGLGVDSAVDALRTMLGREFGAPAVWVSRVDLFADWQGWRVGRESESSFVTRCKHVSAHSERGSRTGFEFGRRSTGRIVARVYDKTAQIAQEGKRWWYEVWGDRFVEGEPVWRTEFEFDRAVLKEFRLDAPETVLANVGGLWGYATERWLTHRTAGGDQTRSRWAVSPTWAQVQHASLRSEAVGLNRALAVRREAKLENIVPVLRGCFTAASAHWGADGIDDGIACLNAYLHEWEGLTGHTIAGAIAMKRRNWGWGL